MAISEVDAWNKQTSASMNMTDAEICRFYNGIIVAANKPVWFHRITSNSVEARKYIGDVLDELLSVGLSASIGPAGFPLIKII